MKSKSKSRSMDVQFKEDYWCVYVHRDFSGKIFYAGKGQQLRAFNTMMRSPPWMDYVAEFGVAEISVVKTFESEFEASEAEGYLIQALKNNGAPLVNVKMPKRGIWVGIHGDQAIVSHDYWTLENFGFQYGSLRSAIAGKYCGGNTYKNFSWYMVSEKDELIRLTDSKTLLYESASEIEVFMNRSFVWLDEFICSEYQ